MDGDVDLDQLYESSRRDVRSVFRRYVGCPGTIDDLLQDLYLRLVNADGLPREIVGAHRFLLRMAHNLAIDHLRRNRRRDTVLAETGYLARSFDDGPDTVAADRDSLRHVMAILDELPPKCRDVLILNRVDGLTHAEIAARLNVSKSSVEKYSIRALLHLRTRLAQIEDR